MIDAILSRAARLALDNAGYSSERTIDVGPFARAYQKEGFTASPSVWRFLESYGGLRFSLPHPKHPTVTLAFDFDPVRAASSTYPEKVDDLAARAGAPLCPIGQALGGVLLMDSSGAVYSALDEWFVKLGSSGEEAIEALCVGLSGTVMP